MGERSGIRAAASLVFLLTLLVAPLPMLRAQSSPGAGKTDRSERKSSKTAGKPSQATGAAEAVSPPSDDAPTPAKPGGLRMSRAVVCKAIDGYEKFKPLPGAAQTSDEKLLIYYRPLRYKVEFVDGFYRAHLVQDNEIRRRGRKEIVRQKKKVVDFDLKSKELGPLYVRNTISLKGLEPGDYDLTIILHDELEKGSPPTRQVVKFRVIPPADPRTKPVVKQPAGEPGNDPSSVPGAEDGSPDR